MQRSRFITSAVICLSVCLSTTGVAGWTVSESYVSGGADVWGTEPTGGHGFLDLGIELKSESQQTKLRFRFHTDTAQVGWRDVPITDQLKWSIVGKAQYPFAKLLTDYYSRGSRQQSREFSAGYGLGKAMLHYSPGNNHFFDISTGLRRWYFRRKDTTSDALRLPASTWAVESRLNYTYWNVRSHPSQYQRVYPFMRVRGIAGGISLSIHGRLQHRNWGADDSQFQPRDPRNRPDNPISTAMQWGVIGVPRKSPVYLRLEERIRWGSNEDDLTRDRLGGLNPWVTSIAGLPWGVQVSGRYAMSRAELRWAGWHDNEIGIFGDIGVLADPRRLGEFNSFGHTGGFGAMLELRQDNWIFNSRAGVALPARWLAQRPTGSLWLSVGRHW